LRYAFKLGLPEDEAEDAAQQTMVAFSSAYRAGTYDREKGRLRHWLFGIARNEIRNAIRHRGKRERQIPNQTDQTDYFENLGEDGRLEALWEEEWRQTVLQQCLEEARQVFEPRTMEAFELYAWKGWTVKQVAERLSMSENAVFLAKHKVLKRIREMVPLMEEAW
jgi:RNA polymerase sigma-70 factor (ECF subfamily)